VSAQPDGFRVDAEFGDPDLAGAVLGRIVGILGARVALPIDRLSDALLVSDALVAATEGSRSVSVEASLEPKRLALSVGPLEPGTADRLILAIEAPMGAGALGRLVDDLRTTSERDDEFLVLALSPA
jgi:serine/threonine-protein kinase RsbW